MTNMRSILLSLLIAVAFGTVATASASAASPEWWVEGKVIANNETVAEAVTVTKAITIKDGSLTGECSAVKIHKGIIKPGNENSTEGLTFEGCKVVGQPHCEVPNFTSEPLILPLEESTGGIRLNFKAKNGGTLLAVLVIKHSGGSCVVEGTYDLTSGVRIGMVCIYPTIETEKVEHELVFNKESGSEVFLNGTTATFEGSFVIKLSSGKKWSAL